MGSSLIIKKLFIILAILLVIILLLYCTSFAWGRGLLVLGFGPKPLYEEYPNTLWVSNDPQIYMTVSASPYDHSESYLVVNGEKKEVVLYISQLEDHAHISFLSADGNSGRAVLEGDHVRVSDYEISWNVTNDEVFDWAYSTIILERQR